MEIMTIEFGDCFERVWSDHDAALLGHKDITAKNIMIGDCIERGCFDEDDVLPVDPWPMLRKAA